MKKSVINILFYMGIFFLSDLWACSIFTSSVNGRVLVGANEDGNTSFHSVWFVPATKDTYGAVFFGRTSNMQAQAGMNEHGLFFDFAAIPRIDPKNREIDFIGLTEILATSKNVDEALALFEKHTYSAFSSQLLLADATGQSVIINAETIMPKTRDYQITTNFNICDLHDKSYKCLRYDKIEQSLSSANDISIPLFRDILDDVHQEGAASTHYSNVYDLKNRKIYMNWFHNYKETAVIDLNEELKKGFRIENLANHFKQKTFAAINFQESEDSYFYHMMINEYEQKGLEALSELFKRFLRDYPEKADRIKEDFTWIPFTLISKARIAYDNMSFDYYYINFLHDYKTIWHSDNKLLFQALEILEYIETNDLKKNDFHFHEMSGYIHMVLGNNETAILNYEQAIAAAEEGSWENKRASNTLKKIKEIESP
jgi:hypothetical protein